MKLLKIHTMRTFIAHDRDRMAKYTYFQTNNVWNYRHFRSSTALNLNRVFTHWDDCIVSSDGEIRVNFDANDARYKHVTDILKMKEGDTLRCGISDVGMKDRAMIEVLDESKMTINFGKKEDLIVSDDIIPKVDLVLAVPRPLRFERLLPVISSMGVGNLVMIGANKVPKEYFGSHMFRNKKVLREAFTEGLSQAEVDYHIPSFHFQRKLHLFLEKDLDVMFPKDKYHRIIAHPILPKRKIDNLESDVNGSDVLMESRDIPTNRLFHKSNKMFQQKKKSRIVVVVGPEGGWEQNEIEAFIDRDFELINIGNRILRTDVAVRLASIIEVYTKVIYLLLFIGSCSACFST